MSRFELSEWAQGESCQEYQDTADHYIVERQTLLEVFGSFYRRFLGVGKSNRVLDLGCGDGILGATLRALDDTIRMIEVDGSSEMLEAARRRLAVCPSTEFTHRTFQQILAEEPVWSGLDLVASGFAIHHLESHEKAAMFRRIHAMLRPGGYFVNLDVVLASAKVAEEWQFELWREWIVNRQRKLGLTQDFSGVPEAARVKEENKYEALEGQLAMLRAAGFREVECHYRHGLFGLYSGMSSC